VFLIASSQDAIDEHKKHDCSDHNYEFGAPPVHPELGVLQSSAFSQLKRVQSLHEGKKNSKADPICATTVAAIPKSPHPTKFVPSKIDEEADMGHSHSVDDGHSHGAGCDHDHGHEHGSYQNDHSHADESTPLTSKNTHKGHSHGHAHGHLGEGGQITVSSAITFWGALMVHSTLEGFGIGVTSSVQQAAIVFAILIHKGFESLALSGALLDSKMSFSLYCFLYGIFCCSVPFGAILGALLKSNSANSPFSGIITGLASGSFM
jgi:zinc transporter ZupT